MIIQCPACNTSFSVSTEKFGAKNRKVKCSKCYFIWTANSQGKAIEVPPLYESINSQGGVIKENKNETLDPNIEPDHPLPVPVKEKDNEKGDLERRKRFLEIQLRQKQATLTILRQPTSIKLKL